jgi:DNA-binding XRE family transcriptional regulator
MVVVAQLVRALDCGSRGCEFEARQSPKMVYFIENTVTKNIKIGYAKNVKNRLYQLQVSSAEKLKVLGVGEGEIKDEQELHKILIDDKLSGEWFKPTSSVLLAVETYSKPFLNGITKKFNEIKTLRMSKLLTAQDVATKMGITRQGVKDLEDRFDDKSISIKTLEKYLDAIGVRMELKFLES